MANIDHPTTLDHELSRAVDDLQSALSHAADAAGEIRRLIPRVSAIDAMLDELDSALHASRRKIAEGDEATSPASRPTLVVPGAAAHPAQPIPRPFESGAPDDPAVDPWSQIASAWPASTQQPSIRASTASGSPDEAPAAHPDAPALVCFRLEFESRPGPLDLRTVDDAVSEHPAVHDVALLDYDGKHASLKVWIDETSTPAGVQEMLLERAAEIFGADNDVTIVALEDAA